MQAELFIFTMNTTENIVETYYRVCRKCFTMQDIKVLGGNNRQFDLLAFSVIDQTAFHVESSISITDARPLRMKDELGVIESLKKKFFGDPPIRQGARTDHARGINYGDKIDYMYKSLGLNPQKIERVCCRWAFYDENEKLKSFLNTNKIIQLSFRDTVLPELEQTLTTAHYENDGMRTISLIREYRRQTTTA